MICALIVSMRGVYVCMYRENILTKGILIEVCVLGDKHFFRGCVNDVKMMFESYRYILCGSSYFYKDLRD